MRHVAARALCLFAAVGSDAAFLLGGRPTAPLRRPRAILRLAEEGGADGPVATPEAEADGSPVAESTLPVELPRTADGEVDLASLDFDQRLAILASQIPDKRTEEVDDKDVDRSDENPLKPQFWGLIWDDLQSVSWPSLKQVLQTLYISQLSFVAIIILVVVFDTFTEASVRWLVLGDPPTKTLETIINSKFNSGP